MQQVDALHAGPPSGACVHCSLLSASVIRRSLSGRQFVEVARLASPGGTQGYAEVAVLIAVLGFLARTLGLGIVALVLSARVRSEGVDVYRPT